MADLSDIQINQGQSLVRNITVACVFKPHEIAYLDVRSDKSETNWLLLDYEVWIAVLWHA